jgi:hypothetical protein
MADRWITVREAARLQSFHDGFVFKSSEWQQLKQVGNAVPPLLAFAAAKMARAVLEKTSKSLVLKKRTSSVLSRQSVPVHARSSA